MFYYIEELMLFLYICAYRWVLTYLFYSRWKWCILLPSCEWSRTASVARVHYLFVHMRFCGSTTRNNSHCFAAVDDAVWGGLKFKCHPWSITWCGASHRPSSAPLIDLPGASHRPSPSPSTQYKNIWKFNKFWRGSLHQSCLSSIMCSRRTRFSAQKSSNNDLIIHLAFMFLILTWSVQTSLEVYW